MKKKILIILFVVALIAGGYLIYNIFKKQPQVEIPNIVPQTKSQYPQGGLIENTLEKSKFNFPKELPILIQKENSVLTEEKIIKIANNWNFSGDPLKIPDITKGIIYIWNGELSSLSITPKDNYIKYSPVFNPTNRINTAIDKKISEEEFVQIAKDFIIQGLGIAETTIQKTGITYLQKVEGNEIFSPAPKEIATILQVNLALSDTTYPILSENPIIPQIYVQILKDGSVLNSSIFITNQYLSSSEKYFLKSYEEAISQINQSTLVSLNSGNINPSDLPENSIERIKITEIELSYLVDFQNPRRADPVFVLKGTATVQGYGDEIEAILYLPAISFN